MLSPLTTDIAWPAPAKLNLFLHITGRRADGYHELQTVFQMLDWGDELRFSLRDDGVIQLENPQVDVPSDQDLTVRAARLLQTHSQTPQGANIHLTKRIPTGAGLGGGSSDAATVLVALNHLWGVHLPTVQLAELGRQLGADVPVFVQGHTAWAEGVGERLTPVSLPQQWFFIVKPAVHIATAKLFQANELTRDCMPTTIRAFTEATANQLEGDEAGFVNVFEPVVRAQYPEVDQVFAWFAKQGLKARLTGTGACVFAAITSYARGLDLKQKFQGEAFVVLGINQSRLMTYL